jgi:hypothetical protein
MTNKMNKILSWSQELIKALIFKTIKNHTLFFCYVI